MMSGQTANALSRKAEWDCELRPPEDKPLVSVVIPSRNRSNLLPRAVRSVLNQTYRNIEVIIVDDASTDGTPQAIAELSEQDRRVRGVRNAEPLGGGGARNVGIQAARGKYIAFLDDDDEWLPRKLERQVPLADDYSVVGCPGVVAEGYKLAGVRMTRRNRLKQADNDNRSPRTTVVTLNDYCYYTRFCPSVILAKASSLRQIGGYDETLAASQGRDLLLRMARTFGPMIAIEERLVVHYVAHGQHRITDSPAHLEGGWREFEKNGPHMPTGARKLRKCALCLKEYKRAKDAKERIAWLFKALASVPLLLPLRSARLFATYFLVSR